MFRFFVAVFICMASLSAAVASIDVYEFGSDTERLRYQKFLEELRCPKCKNNNLAGTNSQIAVDLRRELHKMVVDGKTDEQIIDFMVARYGDFVLYRPGFNHWVLWGAPLIFLTLGGIAVATIVTRRRHWVSQTVQLTPEEEQQMTAMLKDAPENASNSNQSNSKHRK